MSKMLNKQKIGRDIYFGSVIVSIIILLLSMILLPVKDLEGEELAQMLSYRYAIVFVCLAFLIPTGCMIREYCSGNYIKKMFIIKVIITFVTLTSGLLIILLLKKTSYSKVMTFIGVLVLMYTATPTVRDNNKNV